MNEIVQRLRRDGNYVGDPVAAEIERLTRERDEARAAVKGWQRSALAMRDKAIDWDRDGRNRYDEIESVYFDAAMGIRFITDEQKGAK
jgi:hypothetical protein